MNHGTRPRLPAVRGATGALAPLLAVEEASRCACGNVFLADSNFCRRCGAERPRPAPPPDRQDEPTFTFNDLLKHLYEWRVILIIVFIVLVGKYVLIDNDLGIFSSGGSPSPAARPALSVDALCQIPIESYSHTNVVVEQCALAGQWETMAGISQVDDAGCFLNESTKAIVCSRSESCHGGSAKVRRWETLRQNLTYDCNKCEGTTKGSLTVNCCKVCLTVQKQNQDYNAVRCLGCGSIDQIVNRNTAACTRDANGFFSCRAQDTCNVPPDLASVNVSHGWKCAVTPCDTCTNPQLRAKCCSLCLAELCNSPKDRQVCIGCDRVALAGMQPSGERHYQLDLPATKSATLQVLTAPVGI